MKRALGRGLGALLPATEIEEPGRLRFVRGAAECMPLDDDGFDAVISVEAAQHFPDLAAFAAETSRVLRPGGIFVSYVPTIIQSQQTAETLGRDHHWALVETFETLFRPWNI